MQVAQPFGPDDQTDPWLRVPGKLECSMESIANTDRGISVDRPLMFRGKAMLYS